MLNSLQRSDTHLHKGWRSQLIDLLKKKGIQDSNVLTAMSEVPRHFFLDPAFERIAYEDRAFPIAASQTISHPYTVAHQTELLDIKKFDKVLEIGTGCAYQSIVLAKMGALVFTIERQKDLFEWANNFFYLAQFSAIKRFLGDGYLGLPTYAPFDKIIVTAGAPLVPEPLINQLKIGGVMVIPVGEEGDFKMLRITKHKDEKIAEEEMGDFNFVPLLAGINH